MDIKQIELMDIKQVGKCFEKAYFQTLQMYCKFQYDNKGRIVGAGRPNWYTVGADSYN